MLRYFLILLVTASGAIAQTAPTLIPFQGRLTDQQGQVRTNGVYTLIFNLYDQAVGGNNLWTERHERVGVVNGMVNVFLGSITPLDAPGSAVNFASTRYLGITVDADNNSNTADPEMVPRQMIIPAFWAKNSDKLAGADWSPIFGVNSPTGSIPGTKLTANSVGAGQLGAAAVTTAALAPNAVSFNNIARRSYSYFPEEGPRGSLHYSEVTSGLIVANANWQVIQGSSITMTNAGGPMLVAITPYAADNIGAASYLSIRQGTTLPSNNLGVYVGLFQDGQLITTTYIYMATPGVSSQAQLILPASFSMLLIGQAGRHTYDLRVLQSIPNTEFIMIGRLAIMDL